MLSKSKQAQNWAGEFGNEYIQRNFYDCNNLDDFSLDFLGVKRSELFSDYLGGLDRSIKILEVGCNIGNQLLMLQSLGFYNLNGIEINEKALKIAQKRLKGADIILASVTDLPFEDNSCDLIFTSGVLIHLNEEDLKQAIKEIHRCSKSYILGYEYFAEERVEVEYRGQKDLLWKEDFAKRYLETHPDLKLVLEKRYPYLENKNLIDQMFLLKIG